MDELNVPSMDKATRAEYETRMKELNDFHAGNTTSYKRGESFIRKAEKKVKPKGRAKKLWKQRELC